MTARRTLRPRWADRALTATTVARMRALLRAEGTQPEPSTKLSVLRRHVCAVVDSCGVDGIWLTMAVLHAEIPPAGAVRAAHRRVELEGSSAVLAEIEAGIPRATLGQPVRVVRDATLVDVHQLLRSPFTTGIQRVTQETVRRWDRDHKILLVAWTDGFHALRTAEPVERARALGLPPARDEDLPPGTVVVPWRAHYLLPEVALDLDRTVRIQSLAMHSRSATAGVVYDLVPVTASETTETNVPSDFSHQLAAVRHLDRVAAISEATRIEYDGWRMMLSAAGIAGPEVATIPLPVEARTASEADLAAARERYTIPTLPLILCVGSHEPRKNHLGVLYAAELLWRRGLEFSLLFVGGNSWGSSQFRRWAAELVADGRPVETASNMPDSQLWALYRLARCTVFPSFSEGFGLPVAESLAIGTPVVTSDFGSMAELAADGGALCVDPRDHHALAEAMAALITDDTLHGRLSGEASSRPARSWDDYARETWRLLVHGSA